MTSARRVPVPLIVWSLMAPFTVLGAGLQVATPDPSGPTAIEEALIEQMCRLTRATGAPETDPYQECLRAQLLSLRADFGRGLGRLSGSERRTLDSVCSKIRAAAGREAYVECLSAQLASLRNRRSRANPAPSEETALPPPSVSAPSASPAPPERQASSWSADLWIGASLLTLFVAASGVLLAVKARRAPRKCRICGKDVPESGDLCQKCRHEAAETVRRAGTERADHHGAQKVDQQRAQEEEQRRQSEHEEEQGRQKARQDVEARQRQQKETRQREEDARQRQDEEARQRSQVADVSPEVFDPYAVLGVPRDASMEDIRAAYQEATLKYDPDQVAHLSREVQEHYKAKAQAVELAHQKLTE